MPNSYARRRRRERPLRRLAAAARRDLDVVVEELGLDVDERRRRALVAEVVRLADPYTYGGIDAPLPAHRWDLRREFFRRRLRGEGEGAEALERLARELAPSPDAPEPPRRMRCGEPGVTYNQAARAFKLRRRTYRQAEDASNRQRN